MSFVGVSIWDGITHRSVTKHVSGLTFTKTAPGGYQRARFTLTLPRGAFGDLGAADRVFIHCPRTGFLLWEGWLENPGPRDGAAGQAWQIEALGNVALATDKTAPMVYADRDLSQWRLESDLSVPTGAQAGQAPDPTGGGGEGLLAIFPKGMEVRHTHAARAAYQRARDAGVEVLAIRFTVRSAVASTDYQAFLGWRGSAAGTMPVGTTGIMPTPATVIRVAGAGADHPPMPIDFFSLGIRRDGDDIAEVPNNQAWSYFTDVTVIGRRMLVDGTLATEEDLSGTVEVSTGSQGVYAHEVAADVVARLLPLCGASVAYIDRPMDLSGAALIDQLVYPDGANAAQVLDDLLTFEPDHLWEILGSVGPAAGTVDTDTTGIRFVWRPWPTEPRYELRMAEDGISLPGGDLELCNRIKVTWTDFAGVERFILVTADVPELDASGRVHDAEPIVLRDGMGSATNAARVGAATLAQINAQTISGTATVGRRLVDLLTHRTVDPHEIEQGYLARIRELGVNVRITEAEYDDDGGLMRLKLNRPRKTRDEVLAEVASRGRRR